MSAVAGPGHSSSLPRRITERHEVGTDRSLFEGQFPVPGRLKGTASSPDALMFAGTGELAWEKQKEENPQTPAS